MRPRRSRSSDPPPPRAGKHPRNPWKEVRPAEIAHGGAGRTGRPASPPPLLPMPVRGSLCEQRIGTPLGSMVAMADSVGLRLLQFSDAPKLHSQRERCLRFLRRAVESRPNRRLREVRAQLDDYFSGKRSQFSVAFAPVGTSWQLAVWSRLPDARLGETLFYEELARNLGRRGAARAVGNAVAANPVLIVLPCHRVVPKGGGLGGYAAAPWRKERLLAAEWAGSRRGAAEDGAVSRPGTAPLGFMER